MRRRRSRTTPSRWSAARAMAENAWDLEDRGSVLLEDAESKLPTRGPSGCSRTRPLYEVEEAARSR